MFDDFDEAVFTRLFEDNELTQLLTTWNNTPALFRINFPSDSDSGWENKRQYPRVVYYTQYNYDSSRRSAGRLIIFAHTSIEDNIQPEEIDEIIKKNLSCVLFNTKRGVFCCSWISSEPFLIEGEEAPIVKGIRMEYEIIAFPEQKTFLYPDPVTGIERYVKDIDANLLLINRDELPDILELDYPVIYVRSISINNLHHDTYWYRYLAFRGMIHVIGKDDISVRETIGKLIQNIMMDGRCYLENDGQMLFTDDNTDTAIAYLNDFLIDGQIEINSEFRLVKEKETVRREHIYIKEDDDEKVKVK